MDSEFHFYVNYLVAVSAGVPADLAFKISYSSQFVDDNTIKYKVLNQQGDIYENEISQSFTLSDSFRELEDMYTCFHFIPSYCDISNRVDGKASNLICKPDSFLAKIIIREAIKSCNPYFIGIASHAYADTWAHQNFTGSWNDLNSFDHFPATLIPSIGHADVFEKPDLVGLKWKDSRLLNHKVSNNTRFLEAAMALYNEYIHLNYKPRVTAQLLKRYLGRIFGSELGLLNYFVKDFRQKGRIRRYKSLAKKLSGTDLSYYKDYLWFDEAVESNGSNLIFKDGYKNSDWYKFQEQVKNYRRFVMSLIVSVEGGKYKST